MEKDWASGGVSWIRVNRSPNYVSCQELCQWISTNRFIRRLYNSISAKKLCAERPPHLMILAQYSGIGIFMVYYMLARAYLEFKLRKNWLIMSI